MQGRSSHHGRWMHSIPITTFDEVARAATRINSRSIRTPVLTSDQVNDRLGMSAYFKCEMFQRTGSFKFRGAFNVLSQLDDAARRRGVVTYSSGNHALAVSLAAHLLSISAYVVMPNDAPTVKLEGTRRHGARVITYDRYVEDREAIARELALKHGLTLIPPYDHPAIIAGQGTAAKELFEVVGTLDALFVPLGGGGLLAGSIISARHYSPQCSVIGVEPQAGNDGQQSLRLGRIVHIDVPITIADGAQTQYLGGYTFPIVYRGAAEIVTVTDEELVTAMRSLAMDAKIVVEPTGALGFAALQKVGGRFLGQRVGVVLSGGNIEAGRFAEFIARQDAV